MMSHWIEKNKKQLKEMEESIFLYIKHEEFKRAIEISSEEGKGDEELIFKAAVKL